MIESLFVMLVMPMLQLDAPRLNLLWLIVIFAYGCVMTLILAMAQNAIVHTVLGRDCRSIPEPEVAGSQTERHEAHG
jgi:hypothetical protein